MRPISLLLLTLVIVFSLTASAQKQNNNWCFGSNGGVNFNTGTPSSFTPTISMTEGVSSISDRHTGDLLFYASTKDVYNLNYSIMPNGNNIGRDPSGTCAQGVVIVPFVKDTTKYYIFTLDAFGTSGLLSYSVVDMTLDNGLGDVVSGQKMIPIDSGFGEAMVITQGCGWYWLITFKNTSQNFCAYRISDTGINTTPVVSPPVGYPNRSAGLATMKVSVDRQLLGLAAWNGVNGTSFAAVHSFNQASGTVGAGMLIDTKAGVNFYGCEFSPNSKFFYTMGFSDRTVYQYDVTLGSASAIAASRKTVVTSNESLGELQIGPDSNIYVARSGQNYIGQISNCDLAFPGCTYNANGVQLGAGATCRLGLPQAVVHPFGSGYSPGSPIRKDTLVCILDTFVLHARAGSPWYKWQDGSISDSLVVHDTGTYWVQIPSNCGTIADTFVVGRHFDSSGTLTAMHKCSYEEAMLLPKQQPDSASYLWSTGSTATSVSVKNEGIYWVQTKEACRITTDSFDVTNTQLDVTLSNDTTICDGDTIMLYATVAPAAATYQWSTGSTANSISVWDEGSYSFTATYQDCKYTTDALINYHPAVSIDLGNDTLVCRGDAMILPRYADVQPEDIFLWGDGSTEPTYTADKKGKYTLTLQNICVTLTDSILIGYRNCTLFFPDAFTPNNDGRNDLARMLGDIKNVEDLRLRIFNRWGEVVFFTDDPTKGWDGLYKGQKAELGTYHYYISFKHLGEEGEMKGALMLVR